MKLRQILILMLIINLNSSYAQFNLFEPVSERPLKNAGFIYLWTVPEFTSIMGQYERIIIHHPTSFFNSVGVRLGIGSIWEWGDGNGINCSTNIFTFFGKKNHHLEIGAGVIYTFPETVDEMELDPSGFVPSFTLSYRYQKPLTKISNIGSMDWEPMNTFVFRVGIGFIEIIHLSVGYCF